MNVFRFTLIGLCVAGVTTAAKAQQTALVMPIAQTELNLKSPWLSGFRKDVANGDMDNLAKAATEFLDELNLAYVHGDAASKSKGNGPEVHFYNALRARGIVCCDYRKNYYLLLFAAMDPQGKAILSNTLVHSPDLKSPTLPGLRGADERLYELFLVEDFSVKINGYYDVKQTENSALQATSTFVTTTLAKLGLPSTLSKFTLPTLQESIKSQAHLEFVPPPPPNGQTPPPPPTFKHAVTLSAVTFATARADLTGHHTLSVADPITHIQASIDATTLDLRESQRVLSLDLPDVLIFFSQRQSQQKPVPKLTADQAEKILSAPVRIASTAALGADATPATPAVDCDDLITQIADLLKKDLAADACRYALSDQAACLNQMKATIGNAFKAAVIGARCTRSTARAAAMAFQTAIQPDLTKVSSTNALTNLPLQRFSFGLATGFIGGISSDPAHPRVTIQGGKIAADPFVRSLTMGIVNLPLWGYNPTAPSMSVAEKIKPFVGAAFTPYFGLTAGAGWSFSRYLAINAGYGRLWYDVPKDTEKVDQSPVNKAAPFRLGSSNAWFITAGYNLGK